MSGFLTPPGSRGRTTRTATRSAGFPWTVTQPSAPSQPSTAPAPVATPARPVQPARTGASTPRRLAWWRAGLGVLCVVAAVFAPGVLRNTNTSLLQTEQAMTVISHLTAARADLLTADSQALVDVDTPLGDSEISATLGEAAAELTAAADIIADEPSGSQELLDELGRLNGQVVDYTAQMAQADDLAARSAASDVLRTDVLTGLDALIETEQQVVDAADTGTNWAVVAWLAGVGLVILVASVSVALHTRRVLNIGLVVALAASGLGIWQSVSLPQVVSQDVATSTVSASQQALAAVDAVADARNLASRRSVGLAADSSAFEDNMTRLSDAQTQLDPGNAEIAEHITSLREQNRTATETDAIPVDTEAFDALRIWASDQVTASSQDLSATLTAQAAAANRQAILVAALMAVAALASVAGLTQAIWRYR